MNQLVIHEQPPPSETGVKRKKEEEEKESENSEEPDWRLAVSQLTGLVATLSGTVEKLSETVVVLQAQVATLKTLNQAQAPAAAQQKQSFKDATKNFQTPPKVSPQPRSSPKVSPQQANQSEPLDSWSRKVQVQQPVKEPEWETQKTKSQRKAERSPQRTPNQGQPRPRPLKDSISSLSEEEKVKFLIYQPRPAADRTEMIYSVVAKANLSPKARLEPTAAWKALVNSWTGGTTPLQISLVNPGVAELAFEGKDRDKVKAALQAQNSLADDLQVTERDLRRRATAYARSPFLLLRREAFRNFTGPLKKALLVEVERHMGGLDKLSRQRLRYAMDKDREWLKEMGEMMDEDQADETDEMDEADY